MKKLIVAALIAACATVGIWILNNAPSSGPNLVSLIVLPFYLIGGMVSGNVHQPNVTVTYVTMFAALFVLSYLLTALVTVLLDRK